MKYRIFTTCTPQTLYNMVHYNMVLDTTWISVGPQLVIKGLYSCLDIHVATCNMEVGLEENNILYSVIKRLIKRRTLTL